MLSSWRIWLVLLSLGAMVAPLAPPTAIAAPPEPCDGSDVFRCVEATLGIDLEIEVADLPDRVAFGSRLVIWYWDGDCKYRQVVIVRVVNLPALQDFMRPLGTNKWSAMGELSRADYLSLLASGALQVLFTEPPVVEACKKDPGLPPCELPWEPVVIEVIDWPDEDILLMSAPAPVGDPALCFSVDLERGPIVIGPVPEVAVPFFFFDANDVKRIREALGRQR
jgi:hypothetical protein